MVGLTIVLHEQSFDDLCWLHVQAGQRTLAEAEVPRLAGPADPSESLVAGNEHTSPLAPAVPACLSYQAAPDPTQEAPQSQVLIPELRHSAHSQ